MRVCVTVEHRFERTPDGAVWTRSNHSYAESRRYLDVFETVHILARVCDVADPPPEGLRADGEGVSFGALPYYVGFQQFCLRWHSVRRAALNAIAESDAIILKAPSPLTCLIEPALRKHGRPFALQVIGDPWGIYVKGAIDHPLRPLLRAVLTRLTAAQCRHASAISYVTQRALQARYPATPGAYQAAISDVNLPESIFADGPRVYAQAPVPLRLISIGSLEQPYKGIDVLLHAVRLCADRGHDIRLSIVGDGRLRQELKALAVQLGIDPLVEFKGALPAGQKIFEAIDRSDVFVMPSRHEGLPRAMVEAMSRALPCIGSNAGGIPELLASEDLVEPGDAAMLADKIVDVSNSPERMAAMSRRCLERARAFEERTLSARWNEFFRHIRDTTALWNKDHGARKRFTAMEASL